MFYIKGANFSIDFIMVIVLLPAVRIMNDTVNITFSHAITVTCLVITEELTPLFPDGVECTPLV